MLDDWHMKYFYWNVILRGYIKTMLKLFARSMSASLSQATFAAGCFWSVELVFQREPGVVTTKVGYIGGKKDKPTYEEVCTGKTGHAEAVHLEYDPKIVSYDRLLKVFWEKHNPTQKDRQGNDVGTQYRSAIFYHNEEQKEIAKKSIAEEEKVLNRKIVTELTKFTTFWDAEEYHQKYLEKGGQCSIKGNKDKIRCYG